MLEDNFSRSLHTFPRFDSMELAIVQILPTAEEAWAWHYTAAREIAAEYSDWQPRRTKWL